MDLLISMIDWIHKNLIRLSVLKVSLMNHVLT